MKVFTLLLILAMVPPPTEAALLSPGTPPKEIRKQSGHKIPIYDSVTASVRLPNGTVSTLLYRTGSGIREKSFVLFSVNAYFASHYMDTPDGFRGKEALSAIAKSRVHAIQLTFLRSIPAEKMIGSFTEALEKNGVDVTQPAVSQVISKLNFEMPEGSHLTLVSYTRPEGGETLLVEGPQGTFSVEGPQLGQNFWKIWFGKPADKGIEKLQGELIGQSTSKR